MKRLLFVVILFGLSLRVACADETVSVWRAYQTIPLSSNAFIPNVLLGSNIILNLVHSTCPCTLNNMAGLYPGQWGEIIVVNSSAGSEQLILSGSSYAKMGSYVPPFASDPNSQTRWAYKVDNSSLVVLQAVFIPPSISNTAPNQLLGGDGMVSNWITNQATLTTGATCTDPIGGSNTCALLTEDTSSNVHRAYQNTTVSSGVNTMSVVAKIGSGTRYVEISMADNTVTNRINETFDPSACTDVGSGLGPTASGSATVVSHGVIARPNGFCQGWIAGSITTTTVYEFVQLSTASGDSYTGTGQSNLLWRPALRQCLGGPSGVCEPP